MICSLKRRGRKAPPYTLAGSRGTRPTISAGPEGPALLHCLVDLVEQRHRRHHARRTRLRLPAFTNRADELDVLTIEGRDVVERHFLAFAVGHRVAIDLVRLFLA